jgi:hypothetical protein
MRLVYFFNAFLLFFFSFLGQLILEFLMFYSATTHLTRALFLLSRRLVWKAAKLSSTFETRRRRRRTLNDEFFQ